MPSLLRDRAGRHQPLRPAACVRQGGDRRVQRPGHDRHGTPHLLRGRGGLPHNDQVRGRGSHYKGQPSRTPVNQSVVWTFRTWEACLELCYFKSLNIETFLFCIIMHYYIILPS